VAFFFILLCCVEELETDEMKIKKKKLTSWSATHSTVLFMYYCVVVEAQMTG
jgi:hypothetical protein